MTNITETDLAQPSLILDPIPSKFHIMLSSSPSSFHFIQISYWRQIFTTTSFTTPCTTILFDTLSINIILKKSCEMKHSCIHFVLIKQRLGILSIPMANMHTPIVRHQPNFVSIVLLDFTHDELV